MKKIRKAIAKKFKNWKGSKIQEPSIVLPKVNDKGIISYLSYNGV